MHRATAGADYPGYVDKETLRTQLHNEQRGICCYCMQRIKDSPTSVKIEHVKCQTKHPDLQLKYSNLLGACTGGQGQPPSFQHCDTKKGSQDISLNPSNNPPNVSAMVKYGTDGTVSSENAALDRDLNAVLNLNLSRLKTARKAVLDGFRIGGDAKKWSKRYVENMLADWNGTGSVGDLRPFCGVAIYWLEKRLKKPF